jgi:hypothetical protein
MARQLPPAQLQPLPLDTPSLQLPNSIKQAPPTFRNPPRMIVPAPLEAPLVELPSAAPQGIQLTPKGSAPTAPRSTGPSPSLVMPESVRPTLPSEELTPAPVQSPSVVATPIRQPQSTLQDERDGEAVSIAPETEPADQASLPGGLRMPSSLSSGRSHSIVSLRPADGAVEQPSATLTQPVEVARRTPTPAIQPEPDTSLQLPGSVRPESPSPTPLEQPMEPTRLEPTLADQFGLNGGAGGQVPQATPNEYPSIVQPVPIGISQAPLTLPGGVQPLPRTSQPIQQRPTTATMKPVTGLQLPPSVGTSAPRVARATPATRNGSATEPVNQSAGPELRMPNSVEGVWR